MPKFLEKKLRAEYGNNPAAIYGTMNKIGAMHGNKETAKGAQMQRQHMKDEISKYSGESKSYSHQRPVRKVVSRYAR